jgi:hypothetical protein
MGATPQPGIVGAVTDATLGVRVGEPSQRVDLKPPAPVVTEKSTMTITSDAKPPWLTADGHINASAIVGIICALGVIWGPPELQSKFTATGIAAAGWLGASAKAK